jgi:hypothetical protein
VKNCPAGAELFHAERMMDGQRERETDMTMLMVAFQGFENGPENGQYVTFSETQSKLQCNKVTKDYTVLLMKINIG